MDAGNLAESSSQAEYAGSIPFIFSKTSCAIFVRNEATSGVGGLAGRLEDNATPNLNRVVGEAFIKPAQQRNMHGGLNAVRPVLFFEQSEQVLVKFVDDFIVTADLR